jgi:heme exporter protein D
MSAFDLGPHAAFIIWSYVATFGVIGALTAWIMLDNRARARELAALDRKRS